MNKAANCSLTIASIHKHKNIELYLFVSLVVRKGRAQQVSFLKNKFTYKVLPNVIEIFSIFF